MFALNKLDDILKGRATPAHLSPSFNFHRDVARCGGIIT
jgi:hypothetical protein